MELKDTAAKIDTVGEVSSHPSDPSLRLWSCCRKVFVIFVFGRLIEALQTKALFIQRLYNIVYSH